MHDGFLFFHERFRDRSQKSCPSPETLYLHNVVFFCFIHFFFIHFGFFFKKSLFLIEFVKNVWPSFSPWGAPVPGLQEDLPTRCLNRSKTKQDKARPKQDQSKTRASDDK
jgi:hypothetical protein